MYATCSILQQENEDIVQAFLAQHEDFSLLPVQEILQQQQINLEMSDYFKLLPHLHQTDGFFAANLQKK